MWKRRSRKWVRLFFFVKLSKSSEATAAIMWLLDTEAGWCYLYIIRQLTIIKLNLTTRNIITYWLRWPAPKARGAWKVTACLDSSKPTSRSDEPLLVIHHWKWRKTSCGVWDPQQQGISPAVSTALRLTKNGSASPCVPRFAFVSGAKPTWDAQVQKINK